MNLKQIYERLRISAERNGEEINEDRLRQQAWVLRDRMVYEQSYVNNFTSSAAGSGGGRIRTEQVLLNSILNNRTGVRYEVIQLAINEAESNDILIVSPGVYSEEEITVNKSIQLRGENFGTSANATRENESTIIGGLIITGAEVTIDGFKFERINEDPLPVQKLISINVNNNVVIKNSIFDMKGQHSSSVFTNNASSILIEECSFINNKYTFSGAYYNARTIFSENPSTVFTIKKNTFKSSQNDQSIFLAGNGSSTSTIEDNSFEGGQAITLGQLSGLSITGNTFIKGGAIYTDSTGPLTITGNKFQPATTFAGYFDSTTVGPITMTGNAILGKYTFGGASFEGKTLFNLSAITVDATENWWGTTDPTEINDLISGNFDVSDPLTSNPF